MSSFDKVVKLACKPKAAPPKAKYIDPIIAATWSDDGAIHDVCKALVPRLREPNSIVVFKALIVLHTMIRNGATDNVLSYLSSSEILRLRNVSAGNWEGYNAPQNMQLYALYLDSRIRAYRELKHDAIRVQAETNRDMRVDHSIEEDKAYTTAPKTSSTKSKGPQRSKTIMGRKLRVMTVEKGLLRETKVVQKMIDSLVECRFYLDDLEDELTITALRMLVRDLLSLFQAGNEGVINVLEHYFEMSKIDAEDALGIYRHFCSQAERVVEYLGVAKKLQNLLNVPIPNLKHAMVTLQQAPVSLASSLQEYLNDPNFEQNRIEYKTNKEATDRNARGLNGVLASAPSSPKPTATASTSSGSAQSTSNATSSAQSGAGNRHDGSEVMSDFFNSIEEQPTMFNPVTGSPTSGFVHQQAAHNPFVQRQMTDSFPDQSFGVPGQVQMQSTRFPFPQSQSLQPPQQLQSHAGQPSHSSHFGIQLSQQAPQHRPFSAFLLPQVTGVSPAPAVFQPQVTGANPFRQSLLLPQTTGMAAFNGGGVNLFASSSQLPGGQSTQLFQVPSASQPVERQPVGQPSPQQPLQPNTPFAQTGVHMSSDVPARPASTPLGSFGPTQMSSSSPPIAQPVKSHQTGSRNPFGVPVAPEPPLPKQPTLAQLSMGFSKLGVDASSTQQPQPTGAFHDPAQSLSPPESSISTLASSFVLSKKTEDNSFGAFSQNPNGLGSFALHPQSTSTTTSGSATSDSLFSSFSPLTSQSTGATVTSTAPSVSLSSTRPLQPQMTGLSGLKPFKPTSSFGTSLLESLPPIPQSGTASPDTTSALTTGNLSTPPAPTNLNGSYFPPGPSGFGQAHGTLGDLGAQSTGAPSPFPRVNGNTLGVGLRPQATGALGGANPFRATMFATSSTTSTNGMPPPLPSSTSTPQFSAFGATSVPAFGSGLAAGTLGAGFKPRGQDASEQPFQQQNGAPSLI
ncbi:ANTH domain-containing protein [Phlebopus sp. FC_14]|nr:ANTH domain-containing protein [Phlebopus sp. FC_14]